MKKQYVLSAPSRVFVEKYKTKSGQTKNRYAHNPDAKVVKMIKHNDRILFN